MVEAAGTAAEVAAAIWVVVEEASTAVVALVEVSAATTEVTVADLEAVITAEHTPAAMPAEDTAADIQAAVRVHPDRGLGKARARRETLLRVGTDFREITARQVTPMR